MAALNRLSIAVVVPTWNEARALPRLLDALQHLDVDEVVVADGGSTDRTVDLAGGYGVTVVKAPRGRAKQLAAGARASTADVMWFVHADAVPPPGSATLVREVLSADDVIGGSFLLHTVGERAEPLWLRIADLRSRLTRYPYGDQAIFLRREAYDAIGGVPDVAMFEDVELIRAVRPLGRLVSLPLEVRASGRRFETNPLYYGVLMRLFPWLHSAGVSPQRLARWYHAVR
ncbi:MAG: TIGR04283 family arsenosugar biosynthesis glycosyltransferase [Myxococcota bacterium]